MTLALHAQTLVCTARLCVLLALTFGTGTKLVCALGPSSHSVEVLEAMLNAGMVGARIDLTWGGLDFHRESLRALNVSGSALFRPQSSVAQCTSREGIQMRACYAGTNIPAASMATCIAGLLGANSSLALCLH